MTLDMPVVKNLQVKYLLISKEAVLTWKKDPEGGNFTRQEIEQWESHNSNVRNFNYTKSEPIY